MVVWFEFASDVLGGDKWKGREQDAFTWNGGTDIFQMPPGRVTLTAGTDAMQCLQLSSNVLRWYTDCCRTPIANTAATPRFPVIGMIHSFMDHDHCAPQ